MDDEPVAVADVVVGGQPFHGAASVGVGQRTALVDGVDLASVGLRLAQEHGARRVVEALVEPVALVDAHPAIELDLVCSNKNRTVSLLLDSFRNENKNVFKVRSDDVGNRFSSRSRSRKPQFGRAHRSRFSVVVEFVLENPQKYKKTTTTFLSPQKCGNSSMNLPSNEQKKKIGTHIYRRPNGWSSLHGIRKPHRLKTKRNRNVIIHLKKKEHLKTKRHCRYVDKVRIKWVTAPPLRTRSVPPIAAQYRPFVFCFFCYRAKRVLRFEE